MAAGGTTDPLTMLAIVVFPMVGLGLALAGRVWYLAKYYPELLVRRCGAVPPAAPGRPAVSVSFMPLARALRCPTRSARRAKEAWGSTNTARPAPARSARTGRAAAAQTEALKRASRACPSSSPYSNGLYTRLGNVTKSKRPCLFATRRVDQEGGRQDATTRGPMLSTQPRGRGRQAQRQRRRRSEMQGQMVFLQTSRS